MEILRNQTIDMLPQEAVPALSSTSDMPVVETKPDAVNEAAPPETTEVEGEAEQPGESATPATETEQTGEPAKKESRGVQKALDRLTAERETERRRADQAHEETMRLLALLEERGKPLPPVPAVMEGEPPRPHRGDYPDPDAWDAAILQYAEDKSAWAATEAVRQAEEARVEQAKRDEIESGIRKTFESYQERVDKAKEKYSDFDTVAMRDDVVVSTGVAEAIRHSERGPDIQYYLGKNPDEAKRINQLSPPLQLVELGLIVAKLDAPVIKPLSAAPKPIRPIRSGDEPAVKDPEEMSMEEYAAYARARDHGKGMRH